MPSLLVQAPDMGLNSLLLDNMIDPRETSDYTYNMLFERGLMRTPYGFTKMDTTGLSSGNVVLAVFPWDEIDGFSHLMAVSKEKIYDHDKVNSKWVDKINGTMDSDETNPVSYVAIGHDDTDIYIDDDTSRAHAYHHIIVCDGGLSNIQRWAGRQEVDFADLAAGDDYHDGTAHRALQVGTFRSRLILISPQTYSSSSKQWTTHNQTVRWPAAGKLQAWSPTTDTGAGTVILHGVGGPNVWSAQLANQYIIYQNSAIWGLNYVGGTDIFDPVILLRDIGLLSSHLLISKNNVHYFVGSDYNVYAYYGGTVLRKIGNKIHKLLQDDLNYQLKYKCWMAMETYTPRLWIFIVPEGETHITKAYGMDLRTENWMPRDFSHKYSTGGITAISLVGATSYTVGESYAASLNKLSSLAADTTTGTAHDVTERYGDTFDGTIGGHNIDYTDLFDMSSAEWTKGGYFFEVSVDADISDRIAAGDIMRVIDGSVHTNVPYGAHYFTVSSACTFGAGDTSCRIAFHSRFSGREDVTEGYTATDETLCMDSTAYVAVADDSLEVPAFPESSAYIDDGTYAIRFFDWSAGDSYREMVAEIRTEEKMVIGDTEGYVYRFDASVATDDNYNIPSQNVTKVFDWCAPDIYKRWPGIALSTKGTHIILEYRTSEFDTSEGGWTIFS